MLSHGIHKPRRAGIVSGAVAVLLGLAATVLLASPAHAHDELLSTDPAADATVAALPADIRLTFSGLISTEPGANEIAVTDASGAALASGDPIVSDTVLTQELEGEASGTITVLWKAVSSDGHPISGEFSFTVEEPTAPTPTESASVAPSASPTEQPTEPSEQPTETATPAPPADEDSSFGDVWPWVLGGIIVAALGGALIYLLTSRARRERALAEARDGGAPTAPDGGTEPPLDR